MSISSTTSRVTYTGNGSTSVYSYGCRIFANTDLRVTVRLIASPYTETTLVLTTDYTVGGIGNSTGNITLVNASQAWLTSGNLRSTYKIIVRRVRPVKQSGSVRNQSSYYPATHEDVWDSLVMIDQGQQDDIDRSVRLPETLTSASFNPVLPSGIAGAVSAIPATNSAGDGWAAASAWTPVADLAAAVTAAAAAAVSQAAAASSASAASSSATAAASSASAAATSATSAASSASAASTSATAAAASATAAASSASAAATSATAAASSATSAASSASSASTSATSATSSASSATASAAAASASEIAAAASATAAAASAASVAAPAITGTRASPSAVVAGTGIAFTGTSYYNKWFVQGSGGAVDITVNPQIAAATNVGQMLEVQGRDDTNTVKFDHGTGIALKNKGSVYLFADDTIRFSWDGTLWAEV